MSPLTSSHDDDEQPFQSILETLLTQYRMMLGDFDRDWFGSDTQSVETTGVLFFVLFTFMVMVLLLNMLIAIVSDSCESCSHGPKSSHTLHHCNMLLTLFFLNAR